MKIKSIVIAIGISALIAGCGTNNNNEVNSESKLKGDIKIDGSSTVYPLTEAVAEEFRTVQPDIKITVGVSGTGGGFKKFSRGETDISNASRLIKESEIQACKENGIEFIEIPVAYDGLAVVISKENTWVDFLTVEELKKIWEPSAQGKIMKWSQIRAGWPDSEIHLYGPGVASGTYDYFTEAIMGKAQSSRGDYTASEDDNVLVQGVSTDKLALGFFGLAYFTENSDKLKLVPIDDLNDENGSGPITPTIETVENGTYQPLARPEFIYVNAKSAEREEVKAFINFYLENAAALAKETGAIALPKEVYAEALKRYEEKIVGSVFDKEGGSVGVNLLQVLKKRP
ncbi:MAG: PstS family phosphate ABC transporter substrate-binding protein [Bacteroidetes bacterium]|nr:PstS family phosphate ABC transporter substrate-binding protein [Bacteroidota bacterium]HET6243787.1 PstS family phosphate ABC transporter substrate-binding protein [Bacteroidia bacterium]